MSAIEVTTAPAVYELQQRVRETAPSHMKALPGAMEWHHTKNWQPGQENDAYYWKERWESLWGEAFEFRFNPTKAQPVRPEGELKEAPFDMMEAIREAAEADLEDARKAQA